MKQFVVPPSEIESYSRIEAFLGWCEETLGLIIPEAAKNDMLCCGLSGWVDGIEGWDACDCKHVQFRPKGCGVSGCPNCVERATRALANYAFWRWTKLFELSNSQVAVDFITFTVSSRFYEDVAKDVKKFQRVCFESLSEYYGVSEEEELFVSNVVQQWGSEDISDESSPHCHNVVAPFVFDKKTHLIRRRLSSVGSLISLNRLFQGFNRPLLAIFNRRMIDAFSLPKDSVVSLNVNRRFASEPMKKEKVAKAQLFHQLKYLYRHPLTDVVKAYFRGDLLHTRSEIAVRSGKSRHMEKFTEARKGRLVALLGESGLKSEEGGAGRSSIVARYERVLSFGACSKRKVGLVLKALAREVSIDDKEAFAYECAKNRVDGKNLFVLEATRNLDGSILSVRSFEYKAFSKWFSKHRLSCWFHRESHALGDAEEMSRVSAVKKYGSRLLLKVTDLERKQELLELNMVDRSVV